MKLVAGLGIVGVLAACGGPAVPSQEAEPAVEPVADVDWGDAGGADGGAIDAGGALTAISCISMKVCTEMKVTPKEAAEAKERCVGSSGESHDGPCTRDAVLATCTLPKNDAIIFYYRDDNAEMERGRVKGGKPGCASAKGKFQVLAKGKAAK